MQVPEDTGENWMCFIMRVARGERKVQVCTTLELIHVGKTLLNEKSVLKSFGNKISKCSFNLTSFSFVPAF